MKYGGNPAPQSSSARLSGWPSITEALARVATVSMARPPPAVRTASNAVSVGMSADKSTAI